MPLLPGKILPHDPANLLRVFHASCALTIQLLGSFSLALLLRFRSSDFAMHVWDAVSSALLAIAFS